jgi:prophage antirepressor-like protein
LADVCAVLEIGNSRHVASRLDDDEKDGVVISDTMGRDQQTTIISEPGLYKLLMTSRKPVAKRFESVG